MVSDDIADEDALIDLYHEILKRAENSIKDVLQYATVSTYLTKKYMIW